MNILHAVENFFLQPQNLHFLLAILMLVPFILFVLITGFMSAMGFAEKEIPKAPQKVVVQKNLEEELKRELALFQKRRAEAEEERLRKLQEAEESRQKKAETIKRSESLMDGIKDFSFNEHRDENAEICSLILNLISRDVPSVKIAQVLKHKFADTFTEDDVLELTAAFSDLVEMLVEGREVSKPEATKILKRLANGDASFALDFLKQHVKLSKSAAEAELNALKQSKLYDQAAHLACVFGVLSRFENRAEAKKALSLAVKISPKNVVAWNLLGNLYLEDLKEKEAFEAFEKVLRYQVSEFYQSANAHKALSLKSYEEGKQDEALKHFQKAEAFYESIGIHAALSEKDLTALEIIESNQNTTKFINKIMSKQANR